MKRPICTACGQRSSAVNYLKEGIPHYRTRCDACIKKGKKLKPPVPRWQLNGYKKKPACDKCGFRAAHPTQLLVYHIDGNLTHSELRNLRTVCLNCVAIIKRSNSTWQPGDLEPDS